MSQKQKRIGIYAGTFNPVHAGHVAFALQSLEAAKLDKILFLPERQPRGKRGVEHMGHRIAMLERALKPHPKLDVLEFPDINFTVQRTLPRLQLLHPNDQLVFLFGSEVVATLPNWAYSSRLLKKAELVIGLREGATEESIETALHNWKVQPRNKTIIESYAPKVSSTKIREALRERRSARGLLSSVVRYSDHNWLYVSLAQAPITGDTVSG